MKLTTGINKSDSQHHTIQQNSAHLVDFPSLNFLCADTQILHLLSSPEIMKRCFLNSWVESGYHGDNQLVRK